MIITCPNCATQFTAADEAFMAAPRKVRCSYCHYVWEQPALAPPPPPPPPVERHVPMPEPGGEDFDPIPSALLDQARFEAEMAEAMAAEGKPDHDEAAEGAQLLAEALAEADLSPQERLVEERRRRLGSRHVLEEKKQSSGRAKRIAVLLGWLALLSFVIAAPIFVWKQRPLVVQLLPAAAHLFEKLGAPVEGAEVIGLELRELHSSFVTEEEKPVLVISGEVHNVSTIERVVPPLRVALKDEAGKEIAAFTVMLPGHETLPGESRFSFNARLPAPGDGARNIEVAFMAGYGGAAPGSHGAEGAPSGAEGGKASEAGAESKAEAPKKDSGHESGEPKKH